MQALPQLLTRALRVLPQLHAPLPPALANDLRTLAAYLRNYSPLEHQLLQGFVDRIEASLAAKLRSLGEEC